MEDIPNGTDLGSMEYREGFKKIANQKYRVVVKTHVGICEEKAQDLRELGFDQAVLVSFKPEFNSPLKCYLFVKNVEDTGFHPTIQEFYDFNSPDSGFYVINKRRLERILNREEDPWYEERPSCN